MSGRIRAHLRSNVVAYCALFFALSGVAVALPGTNTVFSDDIVNGAVQSPDIANGGVATADLAGLSVNAAKLAPNAVNSGKVLDNSMKAVDIGPTRSAPLRPPTSRWAPPTWRPSSVGSSEVIDESLTNSDIASNSVNSSELGSGSVGADELRTPHEHFSSTTNITDTTAHDGAYGFNSATVSCGFGEELLSVAIDWIDDNGHDERNLSGVPTINHGTDPQTATVEANFDGGGGAANPAQFQAVAVCIF